MAAKITKIIRTLNTGIFPASVMFSCGFTYDEITKFLKKTKCDDWLAGISDDKTLIDSGTYFALRRDLMNSKKGDEKRLFYIIITDQFKFTDYEMCKLAHEVLHITQFMMKDFLNPEREFECVAYTHTHLMRQCLKELRGCHGKRKKE